MASLFDIEFFLCKIGSATNSIANVEKMVLSGCPFWEESDEALMEQMKEDSVNKLAKEVADKIAKDKANKMQLLHDLEGVKEQFEMYKSIMFA